MTDIAGERARLAAQGLDIVLREQWGAVQDYSSDRRVNRPARWFFLHISVTADPADTFAAEAAACRFVERIGQERFKIGCSYNAGAMQSGRLYEMQPLTRRGAHTVNDEGDPRFPAGSLNYDARALVLVQNLQDAVTDAQIDAAARWAAAAIRAGEVVPGAVWFGHRDVSAKSCPGDQGYARLGQLNALTRHYEAHGLQEDDFMALFANREEFEQWLFHVARFESGVDGRPATLHQMLRGISHDTYHGSPVFNPDAIANEIESRHAPVRALLVRCDDGSPEVFGRLPWGKFWYYSPAELDSSIARGLTVQASVSDAVPVSRSELQAVPDVPGREVPAGFEGPNTEVPTAPPS